MTTGYYICLRCGARTRPTRVEDGDGVVAEGARCQAPSCRYFWMTAVQRTAYEEARACTLNPGSSEPPPLLEDLSSSGEPSS